MQQSTETRMLCLRDDVPSSSFYRGATLIQYIAPACVFASAVRLTGVFFPRRALDPGLGFIENDVVTIKDRVSRRLLATSRLGRSRFSKVPRIVGRKGLFDLL